MPHVNILEESTQLNDLRNKNIAADLWIETPYNILYKDPTAKFWISPVFNQIMCSNKEICYSWKELCCLVTHYITNPNTHFTALGDSMFSVNSDSVFANDFRFTYFHKTQIPAILKQITKYLGKRSNILTLFPQFMLEDSDIETMAFIEHTLFGDNRLMPNIQNFIYV